MMLLMIALKYPFSKEKLKSSPGFDKDNWPEMSNKNWRTSIHNFYDVPLSNKSL